MNIRKANQSDISELVNVRIAYLLEDYASLSDEQIYSLRQQLPEYFKKHIENDFVAYVAEAEGKIISSVFLVIVEKPANPNFITGKTGTILNVYTKPKFRRQGIAESLLQAAIRDSKAMNLSFLELKATKDGLPLYEKIGFIKEQAKYIPMKFSL
jgi:Acetyltransferases